VRVRRLLTHMAAAEPHRYVVVDADGPAHVVAERIAVGLAPLLPPAPSAEATVPTPLPRPSADPANHRLKAANLAAIWPNFRAAGAEQLVVVGPVSDGAEVALYKEALPAATITVCRLHASNATLAERVNLRGQGRGPPIAGDDLVGQPDTVLRKAAEAAASDVDGIADLQVDTDGRSVSELADEIIARGYLPRALPS